MRTGAWCEQNTLVLFVRAIMLQTTVRLDAIAMLSLSIVLFHDPPVHNASQSVPSVSQSKLVVQLH